MHRIASMIVLATLVRGSDLWAQKKPDHPRGGVGHDSGFAAMQERGRSAMGVDQYTSTHHFDALADGGRIELQREVSDSAGVAKIRSHIREIAVAFKAGDFSTPALVHLREVPGTKTMAERRALIKYEAHDLPRGAELRIRTSDPAARRAIHEFMAFQRGEHHATGLK